MKTRVFTDTCDTTGTTTQVFTVPVDERLSLTPDGAIFEVIGATLDDTERADVLYGYGITDGTDAYAISIHEPDAEATMIPVSAGQDDLTTTNDCIVFIGVTDASDVTNGTATISSLGSDAITITWVENPDTSFIVRVTLFYETDNLSVGFETPIGAGSPALRTTTVSHTTNILISACSAFQTALDGSVNGGTGSDISLGYATNDGTTVTQCSVGWESIAAGTSDVRGKWSIENIVSYAAAANTSGEVLVDNFVVDTSFRWSAVVQGFGVILYMAIETADEATTGGGSVSGTAVTGLGFQPDGLFMATTAANTAADARDRSAPNSLSLGICGTSGSGSTPPTVQHNLGLSAEDGITTSDVYSMSKAGKMWMFGDGTALTGEGHIASFDADGYDLTVDVTPQSNGNYVWLAFKDSATEPAAATQKFMPIIVD